MNNKGFAITGILYTVFILFIMTMFAILAGLNTRLKLMQKSVMSFEDDYACNIVENQAAYNIGYALDDGKYIFSGGCIAYLKKGAKFDDCSCSGKALSKVCIFKEDGE